MDILSIVVVEPIGCEIGDPEADMRSVTTINAVNLISEWNGDASTEVSVIVVVLSIDVYLSLINGVILFLSQEGILEDTWLLVPPADTSCVLLQDV